MSAGFDCIDVGADFVRNDENINAGVHISVFFIYEANTNRIVIVRSSTGRRKVH